jgi:hypothetical protein
MAKVLASKRQTIDDADLETVVAHLNAVETIEIINHVLQMGGNPWIPQIGSYLKYEP